MWQLATEAGGSRVAGSAGTGARRAGERRIDVGGRVALKSAASPVEVATAATEARSAAGASLAGRQTARARVVDWIRISS